MGRGKLQMNLWAVLLGLMGFLGLLGVIRGNPDLYGFFGFFGFFGMARAWVDERYRANLARAARDGFLVALVGMAVLLVLMALEQPPGVIARGVRFLFAAMILTFVVAFRVYERRGD